MTSRGTPPLSSSPGSSPSPPTLGQGGGNGIASLSNWMSSLSISTTSSSNEATTPPAQTVDQPARNPKSSPPPLPPDMPIKLGVFDHNEWSETPSSHPYTIRTKTYLNDRIKYKTTGNPMFAVVAADIYHLNGTGSFHFAQRPESPIHQLRKMLPPTTQYFVVQFLFPEMTYTLCFYCASRPGVFDNPDSPFSRVYRKFKEGPDSVRNASFKLIPRAVAGPMVVTHMIGETPALLGNKLATTYTVGPDYIECDVDLASSAAARAIVNRVVAYASAVTVDLGVLLEGHTEDELPEVMLASLRMIYPRMKNAPHFGDPTSTPRRSITAPMRTRSSSKDETLENNGRASPASTASPSFSNMLGGASGVLSGMWGGKSSTSSGSSTGTS